MPGVTAEYMDSDFHKWTQGMSPEEGERIREFYRERYGKKIEETPLQSPVSE